MIGVEESLLLVERNGRKKSIKGSNLTLLTQDDILLINRDGELQKVTWVDASTLSDIRDTDLFACWKDGVNYHLTGATFKELYPLPEMVIDYFHFNTNIKEDPLPIEDGSIISHSWKVSNAKDVHVDGVGWNWGSYAHEGRVSVTYTGDPGRQFLYILTATDFEGNVKTAQIEGVITGKKVKITKWDWPTGQKYYGEWCYGYWETKHAEKLDKNGYKVYANFNADTASGEESWRWYPTENGYQSMVGKAYSKYDDTTVSEQAWVYVKGFSINPSRIFDYSTNGKVGGNMRPKVDIPNEDKIYGASGTEMSVTWKLKGMTKGNEEATFGSVSNQIDSTRDREPRIYFKNRTRNGAITLEVEVVNSDNFEYARDSIQFTIGN